MKQRATSAAEKATFWQGHVERWQQSHRSQREYCRLNGVSLSTFQWWRRVLLKKEKRASFEIVPLGRMAPAETRQELTPALTVVVAGGRFRVEVGDEARAETLHLVLNVLEERWR
jgi:hypothetical protein